MEVLKEAYNTKRQIIEEDKIKNIAESIKNTDISILLNSDNTMHLESTKGINYIRKAINIEVEKYINDKFPPNLVFNTLPLSENSCLLKI